MYLFPIRLLVTDLMLHVPELAQDAGPLPRLAVRHRLLLIQARQQPRPGLDQKVGRGLKLLEKRNIRYLIISQGKFQKVFLMRTVHYRKVFLPSDLLI